MGGPSTLDEVGEFLIRFFHDLNIDFLTINKLVRRLTY